MKILALYLPQFHRTPENDEWWGEGYTEWTAVKNAKPMYRGHLQPKIPLNENYYDLSDETGDVWKWQADLANKYGVYGFCIYHYWLGNGKQLLQKPMEILLNHPEINIKYCICWANHDWTRAWYGTPGEVLCEQTYGDESEWRKHFDYLMPFFLDKRYIKKDNRPIVNIYCTENIDNLKDMRIKWDLWAKEIGFKGIYLVSANCACGIDKKNEETIDAYYNFEPSYSYYHEVSGFQRWIDFQERKIRLWIGRMQKRCVCGYRPNGLKVYKSIEKTKLLNGDKKVYPGIFPQWDNTPRKKDLGMSFVKCSPDIFGKTLKILNLRLAENDFVYLNAWNEWGEGCYVEPDEHFKYKYLEEIRNIVKKEN